MSKTTPSNDPSSFTLPDPIKLMDNLSKALQIGASLAQRMAERQQEDAQNADPEAAMKPVEPIFKTFTEIAQSYAQHPERWAEASWQLWQGYAQLMQNTWSRMMGETPRPGHFAGAVRQALQGPGLVEQPDVRLLQAGLPADRALGARHHLCVRRCG
jgi:hypothetical protein